MRHGSNCKEGPKDGKDGRDGESIKGDQGNPGESIKGDRGEKGDLGNVGPAGESIVGPMGPPGESIVGAPGADGSNSIVEVIDPCGPTANQPDEVLFRLSTGEIVAWYKNIGLVALKQNVNYITTDSQACKFKINSNNEIEEW
jgi:hypothetical protein